jgi:hypothetical protein
MADVRNCETGATPALLCAEPVVIYGIYETCIKVTFLECY